MLDGFQLEVNIQGGPAKMLRERAPDLEHRGDGCAAEPREFPKGQEEFPAVETEEDAVTGDPRHLGAGGIPSTLRGSHLHAPE